MDYEKAYKTSLKTAAQWIKDGCTDKEKICLECVFLELRESEDERIRKWLLGCVENLSDVNFIEVSRQDVLFYLEKQKEQKSVEWSEEDEEMLNSCISSIEEAKENRYAYKETDGDTSYDHEIAWLKSLRPSWKPSEGQMEALEYVCRAYSSGGAEKSLYNNLKKLCEQLQELV